MGPTCNYIYELVRWRFRTLGQHFSLKTLETKRSSLDDPEAAKVLQAEPTEIGKVLQDALVPWNLPEDVNWDLKSFSNHSCCNWNIFCCGLVSKSIFDR